MELNSNKVIVKKSASALCAHLSDVKNFEQLMPDTISKFEVITNFGRTGFMLVSVQFPKTAYLQPLKAK